MEQPIFCTLTEPELVERRQLILESIRTTSLETISLPDGFARTFPASSDPLIKLSRLVDLERQCCRFLTFKIVVQAGDAALRLEVTGPSGAKEMIADYFGNQGATRAST